MSGRGTGPSGGRPSAWTAALVEALQRMARAGCTDREIATALGVTQRAVNGKRHRLGLALGRGDAYAEAMRRQARERARGAPGC